MTSEPTAASGFWPRAGWWLAVVLVMAVQLGFIFALGNRSEIAPRKTKPAPTVHFTSDGPNELLLLTDPTLFALPHQEGFSGRAWLQIPTQTSHPFQWIEPQKWLDVAEENLGTVFNHFMNTNFSEVTHFEVMPQPELTLPDILTPSPLMAKSTMRIEGALAGRRLLTQLDLPPGGTDVLGESVVQILVDANGNTLSTVLLPPGCGLAAADARAIKLAKSTRFEPLPRNKSESAGSVTVGTMIFGWQIISPTTNAPLVNP